jgi:hypothetical protein
MIFFVNIPASCQGSIQKKLSPPKWDASGCIPVNAPISGIPPMLVVQKQLPGLCDQPRLCQETEWNIYIANNILHWTFVSYILYIFSICTVAMFDPSLYCKLVCNVKFYMSFPKGILPEILSKPRCGAEINILYAESSRTLCTPYSLVLRTLYFVLRTPYTSQNSLLSHAGCR